MPIKINIHDNTSEIRVRPTGKSTIDVASGGSADISRLEYLIKQEVENRIAGDNHLQAEIDQLAFDAVSAISIDEQSDGSIVISLLNDNGDIVDSKTITLTEKIIKSAEFDEENGKLVYTCNDDSTIEIDISSLVDNVEELIGKVAQLRADVDEITNVEIPAINNELSIISQDISTINDHLSILDTNVATLDAEVSILRETKVETNLGAANYASIDPRNMTPEQIQDMLIYVSNNGIPSTAKLGELGYARIRDVEDIDKVDSGDLLIDME